MRRLSRNEIVASAELLTGVAPSRRDLPDEPRPGHGALLTGGMSFIPTEIAKLKIALTDFAAKAAPGVLTRSGCAQQAQAQRDCLATAVLRLVEQGWRRPLKTAETARFRKLLETAGVSREADLMAVEGVLLATFFSPSFLYRTEIGTPVAGRPALRALSRHEVAARLSFLATQAPPDAELLQAAKDGRLAEPAERVRHLERLSAAERGKRAVAAFLLEWLGAGESKVTEKSSRYLSGLGSDIEAALRTSAEQAARKGVIDAPEPTVGSLLSTTAYLADPAVLKVRMPAGSGKTASGDGGDDTRRLGMLMHPHVLAAHTKEDGASPFPLGLFVGEDLMCQKVPEPPPGAQDEAKTNPPAGLSIREDLEFRTNVGGPCQSCHQLFAPIGYSFLPFDPVGRWVTKDPSGKPWDLTGAVDTFSSGRLPFQGPDELARKLAGSPQVHGCFAQGALEWALGRGLVAEDDALLAAAAAAAARTRGSVPAVLSAIVSSPGFTTAVAAR